MLNKCPKEYANICTDKEKKPTLAFQVVVSHDRQVLMVSDAFFGSYNDKMIVKNVKETLEMINGKYENVTFTLYDENGQPIYCRGAYLIADAGFLQIACLVDPTRDSWDFQTIRWCEFLESIRKDVECFFGIVKGRFRYLQNHVNNHSFQVIDAAFKTCCILHNIILEFDANCHSEMMLWEDDVLSDVDVLNPQNEALIDEALQRLRADRQRRRCNGLPFLNELPPIVDPSTQVMRTSFLANSRDHYFFIET